MPSIFIKKGFSFCSPRKSFQKPTAVQTTDHTVPSSNSYHATPTPKGQRTYKRLDGKIVRAIGPEFIFEMVIAYSWQESYISEVSTIDSLNKICTITAPVDRSDVIMVDRVGDLTRLHPGGRATVNQWLMREREPVFPRDESPDG